MAILCHLHVVNNHTQSHTHTQLNLIIHKAYFSSIMVIPTIVEVKDPCNEGGTNTRNMYTTYLVKGPNTLVRRRYSDFQWLYSRLQTEYPGAIIPIIPHKIVALNSKLKFDPDFIEERRQNLQIFLRNVVEHPELSCAPSMTPFMVYSIGTQFDTAKEQLELKKPTSTSLDPETSADDISSPLSSPTTTTTTSKTKKGFSNFVAKLRVLTTGTQQLMRTADEDEFNAIEEYVSKVEGSVNQLLAASLSLSKATQTTAKTVGSFKEPIQLWKDAYVNFNNRSSIHGNNKNNTKNNSHNTAAAIAAAGGGTTGDSSSDDEERKQHTIDMMSCIIEFSQDYEKLMELKYEEESEKFEQSIIQLSYLVKSYSNAIKQRKSLQVKYTTKFQQLIDKDAAIEKAHKSLKPPDITNKLQFERDIIKQECDVYKTTLEDCTKRLVKNESKRIQPILNLKLHECFQYYTQIQVSYQQRINMAWSQLLPYFTTVAAGIDDNNNNNKDDDNDKKDGVDSKATTSEPVVPPPASAPPPPPPPPPSS